MKKLIITIVVVIIAVLTVRWLIRKYLPKTSSAIGVRKAKTIAAVKAGVESMDNAIATKVA